MPFEKGHAKIAGRQSGTPNMMTTEVRAVIAQAAYRIGGMQRLVEWIMESPQHEYAFWTSIWPRLAPVAIQGTGPSGEIELNINVELKREELLKKLEERGLPLTVFGMDRPILELAANKGNGKEAIDAGPTRSSRRRGD
jgi:hypothetical protein